MKNRGKYRIRPPHFKHFREIIYDLEAGSSWYKSTAEDNPLPGTLQKQRVLNRHRIKTEYCISNFYWFSGLEETAIEGLFSGDKNHHDGKDLLVIFFIENILAVYYFHGYLDAPQQRQRFAENFYYSFLLPELKPEVKS